MATRIRKTDPLVADLTAAFNDLKAFVVARDRLAVADLISIASDSVAFATPGLADPGAHNDCSELTVTSADADDFASAATLVNELLGVYQFHMADTLAHKTTGVALASYAQVHIEDPDDAAEEAAKLIVACARANDIKAKYNTHRASTTHHYTADSTNVVAAADATDQASLETLLNELKADINLHMASGVSAKSLRAVSA